MSSPERETNYWQFHISFFLSTVCVATETILIKQALESYPPVVLASATSFIALIVAIILKSCQTREILDFSTVAQFLNRQDFLILGALVAVGYILRNVALQDLSPILFAFINISMYPIFGHAISLLARDNSARMGYIEIFIILFPAIIGSLIFVNADGNFVSSADAKLLPLVLAFLSVFIFATNGVWIRQLVVSSTSSLEIILVRHTVIFLITTTIAIIQAFLLENDHAIFSVSFAQVIYIIAIAIIGNVFQPLLSFHGLKKLPLFVWGQYRISIPITTTLLSVLAFPLLFPNTFISEQLGNQEILGGTLIFLPILAKAFLDQRISRSVSTAQK